MSMKSKNGLPMPLTLGQWWELTKELDKDKIDKDKKKFEVDFLTIKTKMLVLGYSPTQADDLEKVLIKNSKGKIDISVDI